MPGPTADDKLLDAALQEFSREPGLASHALCATVALLVSWLPAYLWSSVRGLGSEHNALVAVVTLGCGAVLCVAHHSAAFWAEERLWRQHKSTARKDQGDKRRQMVRELERSQRTRQLSLAFALCSNNSLFLLSVVFGGFFVFQGANPVFSYVVSMCGAALLVAFTALAA